MSSQDSSLRDKEKVTVAPTTQEKDTTAPATDQVIDGEDKAKNDTQMRKGSVPEN